MGPYVPPGQSPPFEVVDDLHHGAWIIITAALGLVVSLVCLLIRLYVRLMLIPPFARDDLILLGATALGIVQSILVFYACSLGFGTSIFVIDLSRLGQIQALITASDVFSLIVLYLSKCCVIAIYLRLTPQKPHNMASWATAVVCTAWLIPAIFILLINCELNKPWRTQGGQCRNLYQRWQFIASVDVITELALFFLAVALLKGLFMSVKRKIGIGFAFIFRFPLLAFALLHISTLNTALNDEDITLAAIEPTLWLQVEVHYALVACSIFCLRPFMAAVSTNYGTAGDSNLESSGSRSRATKESSGSNSRSRSMTRARGKRAGAASRMPRSGSKEELFRGNSVCTERSDAYFDTATHRSERCRKGKKADYQDQDPGSMRANSRDPATRLPMRRSMFPLAGSGKETHRIEKNKSPLEGNKPGPTHDPDAIELMPQPRRKHGSQALDAGLDGEEVDRMVIRKEVGYSVQYEDEEAERYRDDISKSRADAVAHI